MSAYPNAPFRAVVAQSRQEDWGPRMRVYSDAGDSGWLDVTNEPMDDTPLALLAAAAAEHPEIRDALEPVLAQDLGYALILDGQSVPSPSPALVAFLTAMDLADALDPPPPASAPSPRL